MNALVRVLAALLLHASMAFAWLLFFVAVPVYGLWRAADSGQVGWAVGCVLFAGFAGWLWIETSRKFGLKQTFSDDSGPLI